MKFGYTTRGLLKKITDDNVFAIQKAVAELEFPWVFGKSLWFALFKVRYPCRIPIPPYLPSARGVRFGLLAISELSTISSSESP